MNGINGTCDDRIHGILWSILALYLIVAAAKWVYGLMTHSLSMQVDGLHSSFDGLSNVIGLFGLWLKNLSATINFCTKSEVFLL